MDGFPFAVGLVSALGCGLVAGVFFAFSSAIMKALARLPAAQGIAAMQSINIVIINPVFLAAFVGTAIVCAVSVIVALITWGDAGSGYLLLGGLCYLIGAFGVTAAINVPKNDALAKVEPSSEEGHRLWARYVPSWTAWNHVRAVAALAAAAIFILALID